MHSLCLILMFNLDCMNTCSVMPRTALVNKQLMNYQNSAV
jgi:hypothetical protein